MVISPSPAGRALAACLVGVLLLVGASPAQAQQQRITFNEAVQIALEQNINLKQAANAVDQQAVLVDRRRTAFLPSLSFNSNGRGGIGREFNTTTGNLVDQTTYGFSTGLSTNLTVFNGFGRMRDYEQAQTNLTAQDLRFERQRQAVVFSVMSNYLTLIERGEQVRIQQENLESQRQLLEQIQEFVNVGSRPISDLYQQQAQVATAELDLLNVQRLAQISEANLIQTLQLDPFDQYEFVVPSVEDADFVMQTYDVSDMLRQAYGQRPDLEAQQRSIEAAQLGIQVAESNYWPSISLSGGYGSGYSSAAEAISFQDQFTDFNRQGDLTLQLSYPIFNRFTRRQNVQAAEIEYESAQFELEGLQQDIAVQVRQAYLDYLTAEKRLDVTQVQLQAAEQALEAEQERYNVGASTLVELSQARATFVQAAGNRVQARYNFLFQERLIEYYLGVLDPTQPLFR